MWVDDVSGVWLEEIVLCSRVIKPESRAEASTACDG